MTANRRDEIIEVLHCDLEVRPMTAPGVGQLLPHVRGATRTSGTLVVEFDKRAAHTLGAFVEAERLCCANIGWAIEREPLLCLRISADEVQLTAIESIWGKHDIESHQ